MNITANLQVVDNNNTNDANKDHGSNSKSKRELEKVVYKKKEIKDKCIVKVHNHKRKCTNYMVLMELTVTGARTGCTFASSIRISFACEHNFFKSLSLMHSPFLSFSIHASTCDMVF